MTEPRPEPELGAIEWLDGDPESSTGSTGPTGPAHPPRIPRFAWYGLIAVVVGSVAVALTVSRDGSRHRATPATAAPASAAASVRIAPPVRPTPTPSSPVSVHDAGRPLLDVPRGVELFARGGDTVLRLELATGRITRTTDVELSAGGSASMVPTSHGLLLMASDPGVGIPGAGFLIPDGQPPRPLPQRLTRNGGTLLPGPDRGHVWQVTWSGPGARAVLVSPDGRPTGVTLPSGGTPDGAGNLIASLTGGVYLARPGAALQRITSGALVATGPTRWLTEECDVEHHCALDTVDRATGARHRLRPTEDRVDPPGQISPDGRIAAITRLDPDQASATLQLIDLTSGERRNSVLLAAGTGGDQFGWTPDSRWLLAVDQQGRIVAVDRAGRVRVLTDGDPALTQLALRVP